MAIAALVLGLGSWVFGSLFTAIPGAILGKMEIDKIRAGESAEAGLTFAQIGFWSSIAHVAVVLVAFCGFCCLYSGFFASILGTMGAAAGT